MKISSEWACPGGCFKIDPDDERNIFCLSRVCNIYIEFHSRQRGIFGDAFPVEFFRTGGARRRGNSISD
jgi:hypothetical protein